MATATATAEVPRGTVRSMLSRGSGTDRRDSGTTNRTPFPESWALLEARVVKIKGCELDDGGVPHRNKI